MKWGLRIAQLVERGIVGAWMSDIKLPRSLVRFRFRRLLIIPLYGIIRLTKSDYYPYCLHVSMTTQIDFDAASAAWMANKIRKGAMVYYVCSAVQKNGSACPHKAIQDVMAPMKLCKRHTTQVRKQKRSLLGDSVDEGSVDSPVLSLHPPTKEAHDLLQIADP